MWIEFTRKHPDGRPVLRGLKLPWMESRADINQNGRANVPKEVGERLMEERDDVIPSGANDDDGEESTENTDDSDDDGDGDGGDAEEES